MQQYNMLQAIVMSFYSKNLYRDVAKNWGGKAFLYLLLLVMLMAIPFAFVVQQGISRFYAEYSDRIVQQVPVITIQKGVASTPEDKPYIITKADGKEPIAIIDTSGKYTNLDEAKVDLLMTKTEIISRNKPNEIRTYQFPTTLDATINPQTINRSVHQFIGFMWVFIFIGMVIFGYIYRIIQSIIYAVIGKIGASIGSAPVTYGQILQITMVALTPAMILGLVMMFFPVPVLSNGFVYFIVAMFYMFYGIFANKS
jgi:hypothetical protein